MKSSKKYHHHIWYTRVAGEVKGPFPIGMIRRFVLLGRLRGQDEVSPDKSEWRRVRDVREVIPEEMLHVDNDEDRMRLKLAQLHENERGLERDEDGEVPYLLRRDPDEQMSPEMERMQAHRDEQNRVAKDQRKRQKKIATMNALLVIAAFIAILLWVAMYAERSTPVLVRTTVQCDGIPAPGVNWSNCKLQGVVAGKADLKHARMDNADLHGADFHGAILAGADLSYANLGTADLRYTDLRNAKMIGVALSGADLSNANLAGADLSYANLQHANIGGVRFEGVKLDKAIWVDGSLCAPGSLGGCLVAVPR